MIVVFLRAQEKFHTTKSIHTVAGGRTVRMEHVKLAEEFLWHMGKVLHDFWMPPEHSVGLFSSQTLLARISYTSMPPLPHHNSKRTEKYSSKCDSEGAHSLRAGILTKTDSLEHVGGGGAKPCPSPKNCATVSRLLNVSVPPISLSVQTEILRTSNLQN